MKNLRKTVTNRFGRLFIPIVLLNVIYYGAMKMNVICVLPVSDITGSEWLRGMYSFEGSWWDVIIDSFYRTMFCGGSRYNNVLWTITYLLYGSFLVTLILCVWGNIKRRWIIYLFVCLCFWIMGEQGTITCNYFIAFVIGCAIADWYVHFSVKIKEWSCVVLFLVSIFFADYPMGVTPTNIYAFIDIGDKSPILWHILGAGIMVFAVVNSEWIGNLLRKKMIQFLGKISFSIYLIHMLILCSVATTLFKILFERGIGYSIAFIITLLVSLCLILGFGILIYEFIEKNTNRMLKELYFRVFES